MRGFHKGWRIPVPDPFWFTWRYIDADVLERWKQDLRTMIGGRFW